MLSHQSHNQHHRQRRRVYHCRPIASRTNFNVPTVSVWVATSDAMASMTVLTNRMKIIVLRPFTRTSMMVGQRTRSVLERDNSFFYAKLTITCFLLISFERSHHFLEGFNHFKCGILHSINIKHIHKFLLFIVFVYYIFIYGFLH